ncbi:uncharacterized protein BJX67DRAFT_378326 [Aspergillus lucknowensis]|uniref:Uncharacterized protein n=1 Tax=Aspergillus lucknowensis TaxID=176173 RepID=A0ABR4M0U2_9EURO
MATEFALSPERYEDQVAINRLEHFLFTNLIMDKILASPSPRVVNVSSDGHRLSPIRWADYNVREGETVSLAEKLGSKGLRYHSPRPGTIPTTNLANDLDFTVLLSNVQALDKSLSNEQGWRQSLSTKTAEQGATNIAYAAFEPSLRDTTADWRTHGRTL